ncbi:hypothetical protein HanPSC8_Chr16g0711691 [Helianthus annuus]|nr:hypothetical protein HanPSC8_Chr16g0711691 [Helianthus annuus]
MRERVISWQPCMLNLSPLSCFYWLHLELHMAMFPKVFKYLSKTKKPSLHIQNTLSLLNFS